MTNEENIDETLNTVRKPLLTPLRFMVIGIVLTLGLAVGYHFVINPMIQQANLKKDLNQNKAYASVQAINTEAIEYKGEIIEGTNPEQKALAINGSATTPASFIFSNGKNTDKIILEVYVDFASQRSRDFLSMNRSNLNSLIELGKLEVRIIPVPTGNSFNLYMTEAIAESMHLSSANSWKFMFELVRLSAAVDTENIDDSIGMIVDTANTVGVKGITADGIKNGTFASWIINNSNDERLASGGYPPIIIVDGRVIDINEVNVNDPNVFRNEVLR